MVLARTCFGVQNLKTIDGSGKVAKCTFSELARRDLGRPGIDNDRLYKLSDLKDFVFFCYSDQW